MTTYNVAFSGCSRTGKTTAVSDLAAAFNMQPVGSPVVQGNQTATLIRFISRDLLSFRRAAAIDRTIVDYAAWEILSGRTPSQNTITINMSVIDPTVVFVFTKPIIKDKSRGLGVDYEFAQKIIEIYKSLEYDPIVLPNYEECSAEVMKIVVDKIINKAGESNFFDQDDDQDDDSVIV